jgi:hypothetical protein
MEVNVCSYKVIYKYLVYNVHIKDSNYVGHVCYVLLQSVRYSLRHETSCINTDLI